MPVGTLVTVPVPEPLGVTVNVRNGANVAVIAVSVVIDTAHVPVPMHPPPNQPVKIDPVDGAAVSVTDAPSA